MNLRRRLLGYRNAGTLAPLVDAYLRQGTPRPSLETWQVVTDLALREPRDRRRSFSASGLDRCMRQQVMKLLGFPEVEVPDHRLANIFSDGNWRHLRWQSIFLDMGIVARGRWEEDNGVTLIPTDEHLLEVGVYTGVVRGTIDAIVEIEGERWIVDIKGANSRVFSDLRAGGKPYPAYLLQLYAYMQASRIPRAILWYEDKGSQDVLEVQVKRDDPGLAELYAARVGALELYKNRRELPPQVPKATAAPQCRGCAFQLDCPGATWTDDYLNDASEDAPL